MTTQSLARIWLFAATVILGVSIAEAKEEPASILLSGATKTSTQTWTVHVGLEVVTGAIQERDPATVIDRSVDALLSIGGVRPQFPRKAGRSAFSISFADPITHEMAGRAYRKLQATPGVAWVTMRRESVAAEVSLAEDTRQVVGLILAPRVNSDTVGMFSNGTLTEAAIAQLRALAGHAFPSASAMAGGMIALRFTTTLPAHEALKIAERIGAAIFLEWVDLDDLNETQLVPNDDFYSDQWNLFGPWGINGPQAWDISIGSPNVVVAVIDTGILKTQPDLSTKIVGGYDMITDPARARDGNGPDADASDAGNWREIGECGGSTFRASSWHGSHVAGIVGAASNNAYGIASVAWNVRIVPVRVLGRCGGIRSDIINGMHWAAGLAVPGIPANPNPARILNMSLGSSIPTQTCSTSYQTAVDAVNAAGAMVVVAAGNNGKTIGEAGYYEPSGCNGVIAVAATDHLGFQSSYSNFSNVFKVDISAPGGDSSFYLDETKAIYSTVDTGLRSPVAPFGAWLNGTSMAAPHVSGILALMIAARPTLTNRQLYISLIETSREFNTASACYRDSYCGWGIANAHAALLRATLDPANYFTDVTIASNNNPAVVGSEYILTATITPANATGNVTFLYSGSNPISGCANVSVFNGKASCRFQASQINTTGYRLSAGYNGDYTHHWAYSNELLQKVLPANTPPVGTTQTAIEYYHAAFDHYFVTTIPGEIVKLDNGTFVGWARTGQTFKVYSLGAAAASVCRFFSTSFAPKSSHFYTASATECAKVKANSNWQFEAEVFSIVFSDANGNCPVTNQPLYRLYNNGQGGAPNHRYTTSLATRSTMIGKGWIPEGLGALGVMGCVPI